LGRPVGRHRLNKADRVAAGQIAPGLLARHYSPRTPVTVHADLGALKETKPAHAYVHLRKPAGRTPTNVFWFDAKGDLRGVARRLFAKLRKLDGMGFAAIHVQLAPESGLGSAINDRLRRAAAR
jgi:L-threonylcarbamoyladenylate synthase